MNEFFIILRSTIKHLYVNLQTLIRALALPVLALFLVKAVELNYPIYGVWSNVLKCVYLLVYTMFAVTAHRVFIKNADSVPTWGIYKLGKREAYFALYLACFYTILLLTSLIAIFVPYIGTGLALVTAMYLSARLMLIFPAIAHDQYWRLGQSWKASHGHQLKMLVIAMLAVAAYVIPLLVATALKNAYVGLGLWLVMLVFIIALLSVMFKYTRLQKVAGVINN